SMTIPAGESGLTCLAISPSGDRLVAGAENGTAILWSTNTGQVLRALKVSNSPVASVAFSSSERELAIAAGKDLAIWSTRTGDWNARAETQTRTIRGQADRALDVAFSPNGSILAIGADDGTARLLDLASLKEISRLEIPRLPNRSNTVACVAFSPDSKWLATGLYDGRVLMWDVKTSQILLRLEEHTGEVLRVCFRPGGKRLATGSADGTIATWDTATGQRLHVLKGHTGQVWSVAFSPDGKWLISGSGDNTVKVWDEPNGALLATIQSHQDLVSSVVFDPSGKH